MVEWLIPQLGSKLPGGHLIPGGDFYATVAPFSGDAVLYLKKIGTNDIT